MAFKGCKIISALIFFSLASAGVAGESSPKINPWTECVGRLKIELPGDADWAAFSPKLMLEEQNARSLQPEATFLDGQVDGYSRSTIYTSIAISHPMSEQQFSEIIREENKRRARVQAWVKKTRAESKTPLDYEDLRVNHPHMIAWRVNASYSLTSYVGASALQWMIETQNKDMKNELRSSKEAYDVIKNAIPRKIFQFPGATGLCLPYVFMADAGSTPRYISITYRLKSHPDITIWLEDGDGGPVPEGANPGKFTAEYDNEFFWTLNYQEPKKYRPAWHWPQGNCMKETVRAMAVQRGW